MYKTLLTVLFSVAISISLMGLKTDLSVDIPSDIVRYAEQSVYKIRPYNNPRSYGTGFWVDKDTFITASHVVASSKNGLMEAMNIQTRDYTVLRVVYRDEDQDIAILKRFNIHSIPKDRFDVNSPVKDNVFLQVAETLPAYGKAVYAIGHPLGYPLVITKGHYQRWNATKGDLIEDTHVVTSSTGPGGSGGPIIAKVGFSYKIIGFVSSGRIIPVGWQVIIPIDFLVNMKDMKPYLDRENTLRAKKKEGASTQ